MMVLSPDTFGTQAAEGRVRSLQARLERQIAGRLRSPPDSFEKLSRLTHDIMADLELMGLIADHVHRAAVQHRPDCHPLVVPPYVLYEWKKQLMGVWERCAALQEEQAALVGQLRQMVGDVFDRVRAVSEQQWQERQQRQTRLEREIAGSQEWRREREAIESVRRRRHVAVESVITHISARHENPLQRLECLLRMGGLLVERRPEGIVFSDNSHRHDARDLESELAQAGVTGRTPYTPLGPELLVTIPWVKWYSRKRSGGYAYYSPDSFFERTHGFKLPTFSLDGMVAYLVKAYSSVGILTDSSCDGHGEGIMHVTVTEGPNKAWATVLLQSYVKPRLSLANKWTPDGSSIYCQEIDRLDKFYLEVLDVADVLYLNRMQLRRIRQWIIRELNGRLDDRSSYEDSLSVIGPLFSRALSEAMRSGGG
jgi:hypothetical protein